MFYKNKKMETNPSFFCVSESLNSSPILYLVTQSAKNSNPFKPTKKTPLGALNTTEDMGFEPTHAFTRLLRFQHSLLSLLSNLPFLNMEPVGVEPTSKHLPTHLSTTIGYVLL